MNPLKPNIPGYSAFKNPIIYTLPGYSLFPAKFTSINIDSPIPIGDRCEVDVPGDNSCLFWAVALSYLLPVKADHNQFKQRFERLFGESPNVDLGRIQDLLKNYQIDKPDIFKDQQLNGFVRQTFRNNVINHIKANKTYFERFLENNETWDIYLHRMANKDGWGGQLEIAAMSNLLECHIQTQKDNLPQQEHGAKYRDNASIILKYVNDNHYHYIIHKNDIPNAKLINRKR